MLCSRALIPTNSAEKAGKGNQPTVGFRLMVRPGWLHRYNEAGIVGLASRKPPAAAAVDS